MKPKQYLAMGRFDVLTDTDTDERTISGLALPYLEDLNRPDYAHGTSKQRFAPGSAVLRDNTTIYYGHDHLTDGLPIGRVTAHKHPKEGLRITATLSATPKGEEVYTLIKDGVIGGFSIGYRPVKAHLEDNDQTLVHTEVDVFEVSVTPDPAYRSTEIDALSEHQRITPPIEGDSMNPAQIARLATLRAQKSALTEGQNLLAAEATELATLEALEAGGNPLAGEVQTLAAAVEQLDRRIATLGNIAPGAGEQLRAAPAASYGEFLQMVARNETDAMDFLAFTGGVIGDISDFVKDAWVGDLYRMVENRRRVLNLFDSSPLPATGMGVEFGKVLAASNTVQVGKQAAEGDTLAYGKIGFATDRAPLETYGGWGDMSRQVIERSGVAVVEKFFLELLNQYAKTTEAGVRAAALNPLNATEILGSPHNLGTADGWIDFTVDAAMWFDDKGLPIEFLMVGFDVFKDLAKLRDGDAMDAPRLLDRTTGKLNLVGLSGDLFTLPVVPVKTVDAGVVRACHSSALRTFEAAGAPFRLTDGDITNLTQAFSVYGYMATAEQDAGAILMPSTGGGA